MPIARGAGGKFIKGNSYWLGMTGKPANSGSFTQGQKSWNEGKRTFKNCERCNKLFTTNKGKLTKPKQRFCSVKCSTWRNGNTSSKKLLWMSKEAREWRRAVRARDNNKCVMCGSLENLHCDHILPKKDYPELMFVISNGRVLCFSCHKQTPTYGNKNL